MSTILEALAKELQGIALKHTTPTGTPDGAMLHGPGALFGVSGLERDIISSRMQPMGLASSLPVRTSVKTNPLFAYITGFYPPNGSQPTASCDDGPVAGPMKVVLQTAQFGVYAFRTRELDISKVGQVIDAGETLDLRIVNDPLVNQMAGLFSGLPVEDGVATGREVLHRFMEVGVAFQDLLSQQVYAGTGTGNEFPGLELLVSTAKYDAKTGTAAPSLASDVRDFADVSISSGAGGASFVNTLTSMWRYLNHNASRMNFGLTNFAIVMKEQLFHEVTDIWPCLYMASRCLPSNDNVSINVNTDEQIRLRLDMRQGKYLLLDGVRVPVITDDALTETDLGEGLFSSDVYILPLTVRGGQAVTYWETFDYQAGTVQAIRDGRSTDYFWTDGGRYLWHRKPPVNWCAQWMSKIEPRLILRTPQLAGRLMNVAYSVEKHYRDVFPGDDYYVNGGISAGYAAPDLYSEWNPPA